MFTEEQRLNFIMKHFENENNVKVVAYDGLTFKLCKKLDVKFIVRGVRNILDFEYEKIWQSSIEI